MGVGPRSPSQPPRRLPPALTLIGASRTLIGDEVRWEGGGIAFSALPCGASFTPFFPDCDVADLDDVDQPNPRTWDDLVLWAGVECTTASWESGDAQAAARQLLEVDRHRQLEHEFWTGTQAQAATPDKPNLWLAQDQVVVELDATATDAVAALGALQGALGAGCGRGMIHATPATATVWYGAQVIRREGNLLLDAFDNIIVPGVGYDGSAPDGTTDATGETAWAYATGIVDTRLGEVQVLDAVEPGTNQRTALALQSAIAYWDGCCHYGINVDLAGT